MAVQVCFIFRTSIHRLLPMSVRRLQIFSPSPCSTQIVRQCHWYAKSKRHATSLSLEKTATSEVLEQQKIAGRLAKLLTGSSATEQKDDLDILLVTSPVTSTSDEHEESSRSESDLHILRCINLYHPRSTQLWGKKLQDILECSPKELNSLGFGGSRLSSAGSKEKIAIVLFLLLKGFTVDDIKRNKSILRRKFVYVEEVMNGILFIRNGNSDSYERESVDLFIKSEQYSLERREIIDLIPDLVRKDPVEIKNIPYLDNLNYFHRLIRKLVYLMQQGLEITEILNVSYLLRHSMKKLQKGVVDARDAGIAELTAVTLAMVIQHKVVPYRVGHCRATGYIANVLHMTVQEKKQLKQHGDLMNVVSKLTVNSNINYLHQQGFTTEDIKKCFLILVHSPSVLASYIESLPQQAKLQPYDRYKNDKVFLLNAVEYFIERDANFDDQVISSGLQDLPGESVSGES